MGLAQDLPDGPGFEELETLRGKMQQSPLVLLAAQECLSTRNSSRLRKMRMINLISMRVYLISGI
jgi:hypothetical protein